MSIFSNTKFNAKVTHEYLVILNGAKRNEESFSIEILRYAQNDSTSAHIPIAIGTDKNFLSKCSA